MNDDQKLRLDALVNPPNRKSPMIKVIRELLDEYNIVIDSNCMQLEEFINSEHLELIEIFITLKQFNKENNGLYKTATMKINKYGFRIDPD